MHRHNSGSLFPLILLGAALIATTGCGVLRRAGESLGVIDPAEPPPVVFDYLCDPSVGGPCTVATLREDLSVLLPELARRPGSLLRVWVLGASLGRSRLIAEVATTKLPQGPRSRDCAIKEFVEQTERRLTGLVASDLKGKPPLRSPLLSVLTRITLAGGPAGLERVLVLQSDGLEVDSFDFERGGIPSVQSAERLLDKRRVLSPSSLLGAVVIFTHFHPSAGSVHDPASGALRLIQVRDFWASVLKRAGVREITFNEGAIRFPTTA